MNGNLHKRILLGFLIGAIAAFSAPQHAVADRSPLVMEGKTSLYQRVLTRPGTPLVENPGEEADANAEPLPPLTPLYVYKRVDLNGRTWFEVGRANQGPTDGWLNADRTVEWKQAMTLAFTNPAGRKQTLFFREYDALQNLVEADRPDAKAAGLRSTALSGEVPANFPVVTVEPDTYIDLSENFYLLPILDFDETYFASGFTTQLVKVAAVNADEEAGFAVPEAPSRPAAIETDSVQAPAPASEPVTTIPDVDPAEVLSRVHNDYSAGVVFVIDTTTSMDPYIDRVREAVKLMYRQLAQSKYGGKIDFGLIGYRDNLTAAPDLEYLTRVYANLGEASTEEEFFDRVRGAAAAKASSKGFDEDAFAGISSALNEIEWGKYQGKWVVLITDAGARSGSDPLSSTRLGPVEINSLAEEQGIMLSTLHLLTEAGVSNHEHAKLQYQLLTRMPGANETLYHGVEAGDVQQFTSFVETIAQSIALQVEVASDGRLIEIRDEALAEAQAEVSRRRDELRKQAAEEARNRAEQAETAAQKAEAQAAEAEAQYQEDLAEFQRQVMLAGRAMQLAYLGREAGTQAPSFFEAWAADRDLENPALATFDVRVLLSRNQLSDLTLALRTILETAERTRMTPRDFFSQLQTAAALLSRTPDQVGSVKRLAQVGIIGEYLEDLPYRSRILEVTEDDWLSWGFDRQREFLDELRQKIELYERLSDEVTLWVALDGGRIPGDAVYPVSLSSLP
ncbi:MAG: serine/threonine protein kinase [Parvibaculum sp.]|uniref:vWA domain-containing protein n=1 Tax=Parvibaculum sp. TaxID=2024848 RepID=UPI000C6AACF0|nr:vWA domain-containing protein [Parvibaculum sp.]MAU62610.1 serine/threonine protein kinase [Parvibaculum sp.]|tara:strand:- start:12968 stop:15175 length:2208 start_codon:yes stop_codon:yes gene_type:complete